MGNVFNIYTYKKSGEFRKELPAYGFMKLID